MAQKIYFDESGFTGNNLLDPAQKYFSYASVATDDDEARDFVQGLIGKYNIQGGELKGSKLLRFNSGRKAISEILQRFKKRIKVTISDKKFALAGKFFEYIFEPCIADVSSAFYSVGFHRFIANALYLEFVTRGAGAEAIFEEFELIMRGGDPALLEKIFSSSHHPMNSHVLVQIREFAQARREDIQEELAGLVGTSTGKWILDLSSSSIYTQLANWGLQHDSMIAICDPSKPIRENCDVLNGMVDRADRGIVFSEGFGERHPITFNLAEPVIFADSKITHGIQIADAVAAATVYAFSSGVGAEAEGWREILAPVAGNGSVIPDLDEVRLTDVRAQRNAVILMELHSRAVQGRSLIEGMPQYINFIGSALERSPVQFGTRDRR